ncbi:MAG: energy transducer TonB family protein [Gemmatimonadota bacterium]
MTPTANRPDPATRSRRSPELSRALAVGLAVSAALHAGLVLLPPMHVDLPPHLDAAERLALMAPPEERSPPDVEIPPAPEDVTRPEEPEVSAPGEPVASGDDGPVFVPHDVPPRLLNPEEVQDYLRVFYPVALRVASVEGAVHLWLYVAEDGRVARVQVRESSGSPEFDRLARTAAPMMEFRPALNQGERVGIWVSIRVRFDLHEPGPGGDGRQLVGDIDEDVG